MRYLCGIALVVVLFGLIGCGSGGGEVVINPTGGVVTGQLTGVDNPENYSILVDGSEVTVQPDAQGNFVIPNLPPGEHNVAFVSPDGMAGARVGVIVEDGRTTPVGPVQGELGGQIVGLVMQVDGDGGLTPLAGVEVIADSDFVGIDLPIEMPRPDAGLPDGVPATNLDQPRDGDAVQYRAFTDESGSFTMRAVTEGAYLVSVNIPGLEQGTSWVWVSPGYTAVADFHLREAIDPGVGTIRGSVLAADGATPIEGASVVVFMDGGYWQPMPAVSSADEGDEPLIVPPYYFNEFRTLTDAQGNFSLNVPAGYLNLSIWAENYEYVFQQLALRAGEVLSLTFNLQAWEDPWRDGELPPPIEIQN
ncbi:MAG TPA: hypothetical protein DGT21_20600 [Armatimonadetes bacterium]|jgi:hypothetical protein|nr:hypothetical protein [Armatimonadota bacterium]